MLIFCQTFQYNSWRLLQRGDHLQVEVTRLQDLPVNGSQLDYNLLLNTQGPARMAKQQSAVRSLWRQEKAFSSPAKDLSSSFSVREIKKTDEFRVFGYWCRQVFHTMVFSLKSRNKKSDQHKPPVQDRWAQVTMGGCNLTVKGRRQCKDKTGDRKQQMRKYSRATEKEGRKCHQQAVRNHTTYQQLPHSQNTAALRPCLRQIPPK